MARDNLNRFKQGVANANGNADVRRYLESRSLQPSPLLLAHSAAEYWDGKVWAGNFAAMVGLVTSPDGKPLTYHRTFLADGKKAAVPSPRKIMPAAGDTTGAAIRLWPVSALMGIAEGIETALACHQLFGIPTWSAISAGGLERFVPPDGIRDLMIFADRDASYTGQAAAFALAKRLVRDTKIRVRVSLPDGMGDFNDQLACNNNPAR
jgi:putative DNA primase/helicase